MATVSFYSFKGGVGRTFCALEVAAQLVARGHQVCLWDLDLEAPALHGHRQLGLSEIGPDSGTLELFEGADAQGRVSREQLEGALSWTDLEDGGRLAILFPAGRSALSGGVSDYASRYWSMDWASQFETQRGLNLFLSVAESLASSFDYVLVDARTGLTDLGLVATRVLADAVVLVSALSDQNLVGLKKAHSAISTPIGTADEPPPVLLVTNMVPDEVSRSSNPRLSDAYSTQVTRLRELGLFPDVELPLVPARLLDDRVPSLPGGLASEATPFRPIVDWIVRSQARVSLGFSDHQTRSELFERFIAVLFESTGWTVSLASADVRDHGVDFLLEGSMAGTERLALVECKHRSGSVGADVVRRLAATRKEFESASTQRYDAYLVVSGRWTKAAEITATELSVALMNPSHLVAEALGAKSRRWQRRLAKQNSWAFGGLMAVDAGGVVRRVDDALVEWLSSDGGERLLLVGPSGAGKTTALLDLVRGFNASRASGSSTGIGRFPVYFDCAAIGSGSLGSVEDLVVALQEQGVGAEISATLLAAILRSGFVALLVDNVAAGYDHAFEVIANEIVHVGGKVATAVRSVDESHASVARLELQPLSEQAMSEALASSFGGLSEVARSTAALTLAEHSEQLRNPLLLSLFLSGAPYGGWDSQITVETILPRILLDWSAGGAHSDSVDDWNGALGRLAIDMWEDGRRTFSLRDVERTLYGPWARGSLVQSERFLASCPVVVDADENSYSFVHPVVVDHLVVRSVMEVLRFGEDRVMVARRLDASMLALVRTEAERLHVSDQICSQLVVVLESGGLSRATRLSAVNSLLLAQVLSSGGITLQGAELTGLDFSFTDLSGVRLRESNLRGSSFRGCDLVGADLSYSDLRDVDFSQADLRHSNLTGARFGGSILLGASLLSAELDDALLQQSIDGETGTFSATNLDLGRSAMLVNRHADARRWLTNEVVRDPSSSDAMLRLGVLAEARGDLDEAQLWLRRAAELT